MDSKRIDKVTTAWGALGTLGMLAASAVLAAPPKPTPTKPTPAQGGANAARHDAPTLPVLLDTSGADQRLEQFVADARALWPELSPEVRAMVIELVRARARQVDRVSQAGSPLASPQVPGVQATQAIVTE